MMKKSKTFKERIRKTPFWVFLLVIALVIVASDMYISHEKSNAERLLNESWTFGVESEEAGGKGFEVFKGKVDGEISVYTADGELNEPDVEIYDKSGKVVKSRTKSPEKIPSGRYNAKLSFDSGAVEEIEFNGLIMAEDELNIGLDYPEIGGFESSFAIDPTGLDFGDAKVKVKAKGTSLFKCTDWDFDSRICPSGKWKKVANLTPGENYGLTLTPNDPAFAETGNAIDVIDKGDYLVKGKHSILQNISGMLDIEIDLEGQAVDKIVVYSHDEKSRRRELRFENKTADEGWVRTYSIDPKDLDFSNATVTVNAEPISGELYKCRNFNFAQQKCVGEWELMQVIGGGKPYSFILTADDPGFAEGISICVAEDNSKYDSWGTACYGTYPASCGPAPGGDLLRCNDNYAETHTYSKGDKYAGVKISQFNASITNCEKVTKVVVCYEWWAQTAGLDCSMMVDADGGASWSTVSSACPGTIPNPGVTCADVTSLENWTCGSFMGATGTRAQAKSQMNHNSPSTSTATWDMLHFNVTYTVADTLPPIVKLEAPANNTLFNETNNITFFYNVTDSNSSIANCSLVIDGIAEQIDFNISEEVTQNFTYIGLGKGYYGWTVNCSDNSSRSNTAVADLLYINITFPNPVPRINHPPDQFVDIGEETSIIWSVHDDNSGTGDYYVRRNGIPYKTSARWYDDIPNIVRPLNYFIGTWNYTIYYNDSDGNNGVPDTVFVTVSDETAPSCDEVANGGPTMVNITIDGDVEDWNPVLSNPVNYVIDLPSGGGDLDIVGTADRDLVRFAYTWDDEYIYFYFKRVNSGTNVVTVLVYVDYGLDYHMNATDKVLRFVWTGSNQLFNSNIHNYTPEGGTPDPMLGSGHDLNGTIGTETRLETGVIGGTNPGTRLETRVRWTDLGLSGPAALVFQPASALAGGSNLPSQLEDNIDVVTTQYSELLFKPDWSKGARNGSSVYYVHDLMNCGFNEDLIELTKQSSSGWNVALYYPNGSTIIDTDGDATPDVRLGQGNYTPIIVKIDVPGDISGSSSDTTIISANSTNAPSISARVTDITTAGQIAIAPSTYTIRGSPGVGVTLNYTVSNYQSLADTIEVKATSSQGWGVSMYYKNGSQLSDTDSDGHPDVGTLLPSESKDILLRFTVPPGATLDTLDTTTIRINSSLNPLLTSTATAKTTVKKRIEIALNYTRSAGIGDHTYYQLRIWNSWNGTDTINLNYTSLLGWETKLYTSDLLTPLTDTNSDGLVDIGALGAYGSEYDLYVRVYVPPTATEGDSEITNVTASSSLDTAVKDKVKLNTTARTVITYESNSYLTEKTIFEITEPVYARGHNLLTADKGVYFEWIDSNNTLWITTNVSGFEMDLGEHTADSNLSTNIRMRLGMWTVVLFDAQTNVILGMANFYLVDTTPPSVFDLEPTAGSEFNVTNTIEIAANATDNYRLDAVRANITYPNGTSYMMVLVNGTGTDRYNGSFTIPNLAGRYNITFIANDTTGIINDTSSNINNTQKTYFIAVIPDEIPPVINLEAPANNSVIIDSNDIIFFYNVTDEGSGVDNCSLIIDNDIKSTDWIVEENKSQNFTFYGLSNGQHNWTVNCTDLAGNTGTGGLFNLTVIVDNTPPSIALNFPEDGYNTTMSTINFNWTAVDNEDTNLMCNLTINSTVYVDNIASPNNTATNYSISGIGDGMYYWNVTCWDDYSNINTSETRMFTLDSTPPDVNLEAPANNSQELWNNDITFFYNVTDATLDVVNCSFILNGSAEATDYTITEGISQNFTAYDMPNGYYNWTVDCTDEFGNSGTGGLFYLNISLDYISPIINYVNASPGFVDPGSAVNITANVTDNRNVDKVWVEINGTNYSMTYYSGDMWYFDGFDTDIAYAMTHNFTVYANDTSGNNATPKKGNFTINTIMSLSLYSAPINFTQVFPGNLTNATAMAGYPLQVINIGNVRVDVSIKGTGLVGLIDNSYAIEVGKVHWDTNENFLTDNILSASDDFVVGNLAKDDNESVYFRLHTPKNIRSQNYLGNVTFTATLP